MPAAISSNSSLMLEEPLIRTPYELLRRSHRSAQRQVEKDFTAVQSALQTLLKSLGPENEEAKSSAIGKLDQAGERVRGLKRKLDDLQPNQSKASPLRSRLSYLDTLVEPNIKQEEAPESNGLAPRPSTADEGEKKDVSMTEGGEARLEDAAGDVEMKDVKEEIKEVEKVITPSGPLDIAKGEDGDQTLNRYIVDYLLRTGRMKAAKALTDKQGLDQLVDMKLFSELIKIETALVEKESVAEALAWCGENRGTLKKTKNNIEFTLRLQDYIELCRKRDTVGAIAYARKNLANWGPTHMPEIQLGMTLLTFGETAGVARYRNMYDKSRWQVVRKQFRETFLSLYALPSQPLLSLALSAGLSSLRLPSCVTYQPPPTSPSKSSKSPSIPLLPAAPPLHNLEATLTDLRGTVTSITQLTAPIGGEPIKEGSEEDLHKHPELPTGNVDCPTCGEELKVLANEVPMSHHVNSTIVCRISGKVMDSQNEPLAFPNGYVYSREALAEMAKNSFDVVTCPRTRESCALSRLRKVYIS